MGIMSNKTATTFSFPIEIKRHILPIDPIEMGFFENLSPAERTRLGILYEQLANVESQHYGNIERKT
jgi:hypothetical protein